VSVPTSRAARSTVISVDGPVMSTHWRPDRNGFDTRAAEVGATASMAFLTWRIFPAAGMPPVLVE
jgi:hypothetical protein